MWMNLCSQQSSDFCPRFSHAKLVRSTDYWSWFNPWLYLDKMGGKDIKCDICNKTARKIGKSKFRNVSGKSYAKFRSHVRIAHGLEVKNYACTADFLNYSQTQKSCTKLCCAPKLCNQCQESGTQNQSSSTHSPIKTIGKTNARCVVCRHKVVTGCINVPTEAKIDFLIRYQTLLPDGARICKKHLIGKHLKIDIKPLSIERNVLSNEKMQEALTLLLEQGEGKRSPINFDGEMNIHTWTGTLTFS